MSQSQYAIEQGDGTIPQKQQHHSSRYPFAKMNVGDFIKVPLENKSVSSLAYTAGKKLQMKLVVRTFPDHRRVYRQS